MRKNNFACYCLSAWDVMNNYLLTSRGGALVILILAALIFFFLGEGAGISIAGTADGAKLRAGLSFSGLLTSVLYGFFLFVQKQERYGVVENLSVNSFYRIGAIFVDVVSLVIVVTPLLVLPFVLVAFFLYGIWNWSVSIDLRGGLDSFVGLLVTLTYFCGLGYYIFRSIRLNKSSVGQFIFGYRLLPVPGRFGIFSLVLLFLSWTFVLMVWPFYLITKLLLGKATSQGEIVSGLKIGKLDDLHKQ